MTNTTKLSLVLLLAAACEPGAETKQRDGGRTAEDDASIGRDGAVDPDTSLDEEAYLCVRQAKREAAFREQHSACNVHSDCVALGDCGNADPLVISADARAEGQQLIEARECRGADGPVYYAGCKDHQCVRLLAPVWCGSSPEDPLCSRGSFFTSGCGAQEPFPAGCYVECGSDPDAECPAGTHCTTTVIDPCRTPSPADITCAACGSEKRLCLPDADCDLWLKVEFERGDEQYTLAPNTASKLYVVLENSSESEQTVTFPAFCVGPTVQGLGTFDLFNGCLAGACAEPTERTVTLASNTRSVMGEVLLTSLPSTCNPEGLKAGTYELTWSLPGATGAKVCTRVPSVLTVQDTEYAP